MSQFGNDKTTTSPAILDLEAQGEKDRAAFVAESKHRLAPRCPECDAIGTLEVVDGVTRCMECDEVVAATARMGGLGR
jgi:hypothetical protein